jgi:hypothetical protein
LLNGAFSPKNTDISSTARVRIPAGSTNFLEATKAKAGAKLIRSRATVKLKKIAVDDNHAACKRE